MRLLLLCLALAAAVKGTDVLNIYVEHRELIWERLRDMAREVMTDDGTDFLPQVKTVLFLAESQVCPEEESEEDDQCNPGSNWLLGCSCEAEFSALVGSCSNAPCQMVRYIKDNGRLALTNFLSASTNKETYTVVVDQIVRAFRFICECRGIIDATIGCARNYDGRVFELSGMDRTTFDKVVNHLDWETIRGIIDGYFDATCGEENGEDCLSVFNSLDIARGVFLDNTLTGEDTCLSYARAEKEVLAYLIALKTKAGEDTMSHLKRISDAYMKMHWKIICDADCAQEMQETFYSSCCTKRQLEMLSTDSMKKKYLKLIENIWPLLIPGSDAPDLKESMDKYILTHQFARLCGYKTDVYKKKDQQCDAVMA